MPDVTLPAAVTAVLLSLPPATVPPSSPRYEAPDARVARLGVIGTAIASAATRATCTGAWRAQECRRTWPGSTVEIASILTGLGYLESGYASWVHAGKCRVEIGECDGGQARSPWQLKQHVHTEDAWAELEGAGEWSTFQSSWAAVRVLSSARQVCSRWAPSSPWLASTLSAYARGYACTWPRASARARFIVSIEGKIRAELAR